jgi:hypothetical protein
MRNLPRRAFISTLSGLSLAATARGQVSRPDGALSIDAGRQLFVDDHLVGQTNLRRTFHRPRIHPASPILRPETALEMNDGFCPVACPFSDGVFYDPKDRLFKMWYHAGWFDGVGYAISDDGIHWRRPILDIEPGTNRVLPRRDRFQRDGATIWIDEETSDPRQRYKMFVYFRERASGYRYGELYLPQAPTVSAGGFVYTSADGIHWSAPAPTGPCGDNTSFFYDPVRKVWMYSIRTSNKRGRVRSYRQCKDFIEGANWTKDDVIFFATADDQDFPDPKLGYQTQLYRVEAVAYESLMLGIWLIHKGPPNEICEKGGFPKITDIELGYSRDGIHWDRPDRTPFIACTQRPGDWNRGYLHPAGGVCLIVGDELYFYFGGWSGISPKLGGHMYAGGSTGLAILRRDGFASMDAEGAPGTLTTVPLTFRGRHLFVNADARGGELTIEILGPDGNVLPPFSRRSCRPVTADDSWRRVTWKSANDLSSLANRPVRLRFNLSRGQLYSFWISPDESGASHGYVAAGGPGFSGPTDTVGPKMF